MSDLIMQVANSKGAWLCAIGGVSIVLVQALLYSRLAFQNAEGVGLTKDQCVKAFRSGMVSSIGPAISVFVVVFGMAAVIGGPMTLMRLTLIGGSATELSAAQIGAQVAGTELGAADFDLTALATTWWTMSINGIGWLAVVFFFNHRMEVIRDKVGGGDLRWLQLLTVAATLGLFGFLSSGNILAGGKPLIATIAGAVSMVFFLKLSDKFTWIKEYALGFALIVGMIAATVI